MSEFDSSRPPDDGDRARGSGDDKLPEDGEETRTSPARDAHAEAPADAAPPRHPQRAGAELLRGKSSREILRKLFDGDPLAVQQRCAERVELHRYMLDMSELYLQSLARIAHDAASAGPPLPLDPWLDARIDRVIDALLRTDRENEREGLPVVEPFEPRFLYLSHLVGIEPGLGRLACIRFNALPAEERHVFWAVHLEGKTLKRHVAEGHGPPELARRRLRHVMHVLSGVGGTSADGDQEA